LTRYLFIDQVTDFFFPIPLQARPTDECLFKEKLGANHFHTFASHKYSGKNTGNITHEFYIAIKKNGKLKHGANTAAIQKSVDFMVVPKMS